MEDAGNGVQDLQNIPSFDESLCTCIEPEILKVFIELTKNMSNLKC